MEKNAAGLGATQNRSSASRNAKALLQPEFPEVRSKSAEQGLEFRVQMKLLSLRGKENNRPVNIHQGFAAGAAAGALLKSFGVDRYPVIAFLPTSNTTIS
jgi:hypothetical protein